MHATPDGGGSTPGDGRLMRAANGSTTARLLLASLLALLLCRVLAGSGGAAEAAAEGDALHRHSLGLHLPQPVQVAAQPPVDPPPTGPAPPRRALRSWQSALSARRHAWRGALLTAPKPPPDPPTAEQAHQQWRAVLRRRRASWRAALQALAAQRAASPRQGSLTPATRLPRWAARLTATAVPVAERQPTAAQLAALARDSGVSACPSGMQAIAVAKLRFVGPLASDASRAADVAAGIRTCAADLLALNDIHAATTVGPAAPAATFNLTGPSCTGEESAEELVEILAPTLWRLQLCKSVGNGPAACSETYA